MTGKHIITGVLLLFVAVSLAYFIVQESDSAPAGETNVADAEAAADSEANDGVIVYYFHNTRRCPTCLKIEEQAYRVVHENFVEALGAGTLIWKTVNVEETGNEHFATDYQLISQSLVLVDGRADNEGKWKNLDRIWDLVWEEDQFMAYVDNEIKAFMGEL